MNSERRKARTKHQETAASCIDQFEDFLEDLEEKHQTTIVLPNPERDANEPNYDDIYAVTNQFLHGTIDVTKANAALGFDGLVSNDDLMFPVNRPIPSTFSAILNHRVQLELRKRLGLAKIYGSAYDQLEAELTAIIEDGLKTEEKDKFPICGWHDADLYSVSYKDIEVLIDRQTDAEVEIRVWRNGNHEDHPFAKTTFTIAKFECSECLRSDIESAECSECELRTYRCTHLCRDTENEDLPVNQLQVYESLEAAIDVVCDVGTQNDISAEYRKQIRKRYEADLAKARPPRPKIAEPIDDGERSHLFTVLEIYELKSWANGYLKAVDTYTELKNFIDDDWVEYVLPSGEIADIQFSRNDDETSSNFDRIEAFAYRTYSDAKDNRTTDTDDCVRLW